MNAIKYLGASVGLDDSQVRYIQYLVWELKCAEALSSTRLLSVLGGSMQAYEPRRASSEPSSTSDWRFKECGVSMRAISLTWRVAGPALKSRGSHKAALISRHRSACINDTSTPLPSHRASSTFMFIIMCATNHPRCRCDPFELLPPTSGVLTVSPARISPSVP